MIVCCGEALFDMIPRDDGDGGQSLKPHAGGAVFNTAIALGRLGVLSKSIIRLINGVAATINNDPVTRGLLQVVYPENYNVAMAEILIPASDLSEQISTAGKEASGTDNMKLSLNGSPTIGTLDGANVEIRDHVGRENFFLFGMTAAEAQAKRGEHGYARRAIEASPKLSRVLGQIGAGVFSNGEHHRYSDILHNLYEHDYFLVSCDFDDHFCETARS